MEEPGDFKGLRREDLRLRLIRDEAQDFERMGRWLSDERVLEYYGGEEERTDARQARLEYHPDALFPERVWPCMIEWRGQAVGYLQFYPVENFEEYRLEEEALETWAMDLFIGVPEIWGKGIGSRAVGAVVDFLFEEFRVDRVVIDPHVDNPGAIRAYEKCGFEVVKLLEKHEIQDGILRDAWLMEIRRPRWEEFSFEGENR